MRRTIAAVVVIVVVGSMGSNALAGRHTWDVWELFSNADGTIQFIELREANGTPNETQLSGQVVDSLTNGSTFTIPSNVPPPTTFRSLLLATSGFAALPGAPTPDHIIPDNFFSLVADTVTYNPYDDMTFTAGQLPTDGINSLSEDVGVGPNSPTNYAGDTGSVDASGGGGLPAVPDGDTGSDPMLASKLADDGSSISVSWDALLCSDTNDHQIVFGEASGLPPSPGGVFTPAGAECSIGSTTPFSWSPTPTPSDGMGLIWWLLVVTDGVDVEGPWGLDAAGSERLGPGANGSSNQCGVVDKDTSDTCGL